MTVSGTLVHDSTATASTLQEVARGQRVPGGIVVGVDGSGCSLDALQWAMDEGELRGLPVHVLMSWHMPPVAGMPMVVLPPEVDVASAARQQLDEVLAERPGPPGGRSAASPLSSSIAQGSPAWELLDAAQDASLLVVGTRGHGGFAGLLLGSVSQHCAAHARCPVVIVHGSPQP